MALAVFAGIVLSILYNVPFEGNPLTGSVKVGHPPITRSADPP